MSQEEVTSARLWFTTKGIRIWYTCVNLGHVSRACNDIPPCWKQALDPQKRGKLVLAPLGNIPPTQSPTATAWLGRTHLLCRSWPPWACERWHSIQAKLAHTPSCLFGWLTECPEHIFPFLAASCNCWLTHSLFGTTQHSCANAVVLTEVRACRVSFMLFPAEKHKTLFTAKLKAGVLSHLLEHQTWILTFFLPVPIYYTYLWPSYGFPVYRNLSNCKDTKVPVLRKWKANVSLSSESRGEVKCLYIWKHEHSPLLSAILGTYV